MSRKIAAAMLAVLMVALNLSAVSFIDDAGHRISVTEPENVAVLNSSLANVWSNAGGKVSITIEEGISRGFADEDAVIVGKKSGIRVDSEVLYAALPDFVIGSVDFSSHRKLYSQFAHFGTPVALLDMESFESYLEYLDIFTDITGRKDLFVSNGVAQRLRIDSIKRRAALQEYHPTVLLIRSGSAFSSFNARNADNHFTGKIIQDLGGINIAEDNTALTEQISVEYILQEDPDKIFFILQGDPEASRSFVLDVLEKDGWKDLSAVKSGSVYFLDRNLFHHKPCQRWHESYTRMYDFLYGEN